MQLSVPAVRSDRIAAASVPAAFFVANLLSYALLLIAAHRMPSAQYGILSSLLSLLLVSTIPMLAIQTVAARRAANGAASAGAVRGTAQVAVLSTVLMAGLSPALSLFLHLDDVLDILLVALSVGPTTFLGAATGIAQGRRRFRALAGLILATTGSRSLGGLIGLVLGGTPTTTLVGVLVGLYAACAGVAWWTHAVPVLGAALRLRERSGLVAEALHAGHAHGTFLLLTSLDVLLARHVLSAHNAGVYAVGSVVTRAALWLPQSVILLLFASLSESHRHREAARRATAVVAALGVLVVAGCAVLGAVVVSVVGGSRYRELDGTVWLFAALGAMLAFVQLSVLAGLAQRNRRRTTVLWATVVLDIVVVLRMGSAATTTSLVVALLVTTTFAAAIAIWTTLRSDFAQPSPIRSST
ncbi:MAG: hypothetical protein ABI345_03235 [Jatrophihabitans sp.]